MIEDPAYLRTILRAYRHGYAEIIEIVKDSDARVARRILESIIATQHRLEKIKAAHPEASLEPDELRERAGIADLRRFA